MKRRREERRREVVTVRYRNGASYEGGMDRQKKRNGQGTYVTENGIRVTGRWYNNKPMGEITIHGKDRVLRGFWKHDKWDVSKVYIRWLNGQTYEGYVQYPNNIPKKGYAAALRVEPHGWGILYVKDDVYTGMMKNGAYHGWGCYQSKDTHYTGQFHEGQMHGFGVCFFRNKNGVEFYRGQFSNDKRNGYGTYQFADGAVYTGYWKDGSQHGKGTMTNMKEGWTYKGIMNQGVIQGPRIRSESQTTMCQWHQNNQVVQEAKMAEYRAGHTLQTHSHEYLVEENMLLRKKLQQNSQPYRVKEPCPICYEETTPRTAIIPCGHVFCSTCVNKMEQCPSCRIHIVQTLPLYVT
jgi:hypothetical protein